MFFDTQEEIKTTLLNFIYKFNIEISNTEINSFLVDDKNRKKRNFSLDIFLHISEFLLINDTLKLIYTCKEYYNYEKYIWGNSYEYKTYFTKSLLKNDEYKNIKINMALEMYYSEKILIDELNKIEEQHYKCAKEIENINEEYDYNFKKLTYKKEMKSYKSDIENEFESLCHHIKDYLELFKFISVNNYYTIKEKIDMRIYGFDPENDKDVDYWNNYGEQIVCRKDEIIEISEEEYINHELNENYQYYEEYDYSLDNTLYYKQIRIFDWFENFL